MIVFNRFTDDMSKEEFHKIVRAANRSAEIIYEFSDDRFELDDIEDPLPFDINADVIEIRDVDYALWYRDTGGRSSSPGQPAFLPRTASKSLRRR